MAYSEYGGGYSSYGGDYGGGYSDYGGRYSDYDGNYKTSGGFEQFDYGHGEGVVSSRSGGNSFGRGSRRGFGGPPGRGRGRGRGSVGGGARGGMGGGSSVTPNLSICIDYIRGACNRGNRCPIPHVDYVESIDERELLSKVKFCHDFQNKGECVRPGCKFLHVTRSEDDDFLLTGSIPASVFSRMQESVVDDPNYTGFGAGAGRGRGRGYEGLGMKRSFDGDQSGYSKFSRDAGGGRGGRGRGGGGGGRGRGGGQKHSSSQPITYGDICVDFLKGSCQKGGNCQLTHYDSIEDYDQRTGLISCVFCHDFQNNTCMRNFCKYVHASRQEENFFLENGYFPPTLNARNKDKLFYSDICLDYLRSQCIRGAKCYYRHVEKVESENERLCLSRSIFCHDYQIGNCTRFPCKMVHSNKDDEDYFLETGYFPKGVNANPKGAHKVGPQNIPNLSHIAENVCREFVKNQCTRGNACRFYHPNRQELEVLLSQPGGSFGGGGRGGRGRGRGRGGGFQGAGTQGSQGGTNGGPSNTGPQNGASASAEGNPQNTALKSRVNQLEKLLADACYCMTLAVGDQNPAISTLMKSITEIAPDSALAKKTNDTGEGSN